MIGQVAILAFALGLVVAAMVYLLGRDPLVLRLVSWLRSRWR